MAVVLLILKIIGKILLFLLLFVLFLLLYLLLAPFHYEAAVASDEIIRIHAKLRTCLHFIGVDVKKDDGDDIAFSVTVLWGKVKLLPKSEKAADEAETEGESAAADETPDNTTALEAQPDGGVAIEDLTDAAEEEEEDAESTAAAAEKEPFSPDAFLDKLENALDKIDETLDGLDEKREKTEKLIRRYTDPRVTTAVGIILKNILWLLKGYMPKKFTADAAFSAGTPDGTGEVFAVMAVLPMFRQKDAYIVPDFMSEDPYFKGEAALKGNLVLGRIVAALVKIVSHSECRYLVKQILGGRKDGKGK